MDSPVPRAMDGRAIYDYQIGSLEGKFLTLVEGLGLRESQENAAKDMLKGILRTALYNLNNAIEKSIVDRKNGQDKQRHKAAIN
jgi:hypothetical protein